MTTPTVSVVVVSRNRPAMLRRCLTGLFQLDYPQFEVIVVADHAGIEAVEKWQDQLKLVPFDIANISRARNLGIAQAAGEIVAFIDDDAVPEPLWLSQLAAPFADPDVSAAGGYVIGRNGISLQWGGRMVFADGGAEDLPISDDEPHVAQAGPGRAVKTEGTNMAIRRDALVALGGFDEAFEFYMDETDLNMRLAAQGARTAIVPCAQVHHGYAASERRTSARVPRDLFDVGASTALFLRKHSDHAPSSVIARDQQRRRLLRHMVAGELMPGDVIRLLRRFDKGWKEGVARPTAQYTDLSSSTPVFEPVTSGVAGHRILSGRSWQRRALLVDASRRAQEGERVSVFLWSLTALYHRRWFHDDGFWLQRGGQFGRSRRSDPIFRFQRARTRLGQEVARLKGIRWRSVPNLRPDSET